jgi:hypothetical protein
MMAVRVTQGAVADAIDRGIEPRVPGGGGAGREQVGLPRRLQSAAAYSQQPHGGGRLHLQPFGEERLGNARHHGGVLGRRLHHALPRIGREIGAANLDRDLAGGEVVGT